MSHERMFRGGDARPRLGEFLPQSTHPLSKVKLVVMMISANGMVPAGYVHFNTQPKRLYEQL